MQITTQIKLLPTSEQITLLKNTMQEYINTANNIVNDYVVGDNNIKHTSKSVIANLPSALKNQAIQDAKSIFKKYTKNLKSNAKKETDKQKEITVPILKKPIAIWNNQNYAIKFGYITFPVWLNGKSARILVKAVITDHQENLLTNKLGALRITKKLGKYIAQIAVEVEAIQSTGTIAMGIDLGLKIPAVAITETGKTKFCGNGRQNKYFKRKHRATRKKLGKLKKQKAINKLDNKEQRWMQDTDHKVSRQLINFAQDNNVLVIRLEKLSGIRQTARTSRKNERNLHTWSFYRLATFIEYKAVLAGIKVEYVNPKYTSQICPACGEKNKAKDRKYQCGCGCKKHRDMVGAINIISAPVVSGNSLSA
ncbi:MAG: IS200/IS605 family element transposase accessory protein TnpB [Sporomusaceae bacterium]|nr:IS200/IS605 family element transposase accessory protein TnpB [Sporomusaceae bacterium]